MNNPLSFSLSNISPYFYQATTASITSGVATTFSITTDSDSYFELLQFYGGTDSDSTNVKPFNVNYLITHQATGRQLMNAAIPQACIVGPANRKVLERHPIIIPPNNTFLILATNNGTTNPIYFGMKGYRRIIKPGLGGIQQSATPQSILPFFYIVTISLAASQSGQVALTLADDSYFELYEIVGQSSLDTVSALINDTYAVEIKDQSTGRSYMSGGRVRERFLTGPDNLAVTERYPVLFPPAMTLIFDILNLSGSETNSINVVLKGYKKFIV